MIELIVCGVSLDETFVEVFPAGGADDPRFWTISGESDRLRFAREKPVDLLIEGRPAKALLSREGSSPGVPTGYEFTGVGKFPFTSDEWKALCIAKLGRPSAEFVEVPFATTIDALCEAGWNISTKALGNGNIRLTAARGHVCHVIVGREDQHTAEFLAAKCRAAGHAQ
jgi:hypothetical protein